MEPPASRQSHSSSALTHVAPPRSFNNSFVWSGLTVTVTDHATKEPLNILQNASGAAGPGDVVALMGPSGSGKTTLLNVLAHRPAAANAKVAGSVSLDGKELNTAAVRDVSTYVEQEDALIGTLTVSETVMFAARLAGGSKERVEKLVRSFGLTRCENTMIGTPIMKGISGGQKRRVSIASQLVTRPKILFLDEPTSGLDSTAAYEIMYRIRKLAVEENMIVICSIHQPSTATFNLFSHLALLSRGRSIYFGPISAVPSYIESIGFPVPHMMNPAEHLLDLCNTDFHDEGDSTATPEKSQQRLDRLIASWEATNGNFSTPVTGKYESSSSTSPSRPFITQTLILLRRSWLKSYRDLLAYWVRVAMYLGLAIMMGTVWLRLKPIQSHIQLYQNAIFFSGAFMSFMSVAYIPAFLEDLSTFRRERSNGLTSPLPFFIQNFLISVPYIFLNVMLFSIITVFLCGFRDDATGFWRYVMWLFLDLLAAESLVILVTCIFPVFVVALAVTAFVNGLWMSVGGFLVSERVLNTFWYHTFYWINYQRYVFQGMMWDEFEGKRYQCEGDAVEGWRCMFKSDGEGWIEGTEVLKAVGYENKNVGLWVGVLVAIIVAMRGLAWVTLKLKK